MFKINSRKAIARLSRGSLKAGKSRNMIAVIAIALTALLFTALFTVGSGIVENFQRQTMRQAGGDGMAVLKYITDEQYEAVKTHTLISEISYNRLLSDSVDNEELLKRHGELYYMDDVGIKLGFCEPVRGRKPEAVNEIMMDTKAMQMLGVPREIGAPVTLELTVHGIPVTREFVLSGWWEPDPVFNVSIMVASRAYVDAHIEELYNSYCQDMSMSGVINCYLMFDSSWNLEEKLERVITESGFSTQEGDADFLLHNVNWSYLSTNFSASPETVLAGAAAVLLIIFTGYLIIYNIFQISVIKDIRFYGLLKTIGATGRQLKRLIRRQALVLSCAGIPIGLLLGYFLGCALVPLFLEQSYYAGGDYQTSANPFIFVGSALFAIITVRLSTAKPGRIAAGVSALEAVRYTEQAGTKKKKARKGKRRAGILAMALANMGRSKKRTALVLLSMSLSLVLFNTVYTCSIGFDMDKFLDKFVDTDFLIAHADYFYYRFRGEENAVSETMIEAVQAQQGFEEGGRIYANRDEEFFSVEDPAFDSSIRAEIVTDAGVGCMVYGMEDLPLERLEVLEGELDFEKLKTGRYILEGIDLDDHGRPKWETSHFNIGDKVVLHNKKGGRADDHAAGDMGHDDVLLPETGGDDSEYQTYEYEVMAKVAKKYYTNTLGVSFSHSYYLPAHAYLDMVECPGVMNYSFNVEDAYEASMDNYLAGYTERIEPVMNYSSKAVRAGEFAGTKNMVLIVGGILSLIIGFIGVLNFVNSMLTSILTRRREFAMLQSIGMTGRQLRNMLMLEGVLYTVSAGILSLALGAALSLLTIKAFAQNLWFFTYRFTLLPLAAVFPVLFVIGAVLPMLVLHSVTKQSVVERLREGED